MALIKGYKTRKILKNNEEILEYIQEIKELSINTDDFETQIKLKTKKHFRPILVDLQYKTKYVSFLLLKGLAFSYI